MQEVELPGCLGSPLIGYLGYFCGGLVDSEIVTRTVDMRGEDITKGTTESGTAAFA